MPFESQPVKLQFCCAPLIFRCIDPELLFDFQEKHKNITLEMLELSDVDCYKYVEENVTHLGLPAIPENRRIAFIYQDYERLSNAAHKFMSFIIENVR